MCVAEKNTSIEPGDANSRLYMWFEGNITMGLTLHICVTDDQFYEHT